jgi:hypothetical protein
MGISNDPNELEAVVRKVLDEHEKQKAKTGLKFAMYCMWIITLIVLLLGSVFVPKAVFFWGGLSLLFLLPALILTVGYWLKYVYLPKRKQRN